MLGAAGVTLIDTRVAAVTVRDVFPDTEPSEAVMVTDPVATANAMPFEPDALLIEAIVVSDEVQATLLVRFWVELSVYTPVAVNEVLVPFARVGLAGVTPIDTRVADVTVIPVDPEMAPSVAVTVTVPGLRASPSPSNPEALLTVATLVSELCQFAVRLRS